jgi:hypothetical protein
MAAGATMLAPTSSTSKEKYILIVLIEVDHKYLWSNRSGTNK